MNRTAFFASHCVAVVFLSAFTANADLKRELLGKWLNTAGNETIEFLEDGTMIVVAKDNTEFLGAGIIIVGAKDNNLVGNYKILDGDRVRVDIPGFLGVQGPQVFSIAFSNAVLSMTSLNDQVMLYKKMTIAMQLLSDGGRLCIQKKFSEAAASTARLRNWAIPWVRVAWEGFTWKDKVCLRTTPLPSNGTRRRQTKDFLLLRTLLAVCDLSRQKLLERGTRR